MLKILLAESSAVIGLRIVGILLSFAVNVVLTRQLGPSGFGTYVLVLSLFMVLSVPISVGWGTLLLRNLARAATSTDWDSAKGLFRGGIILAAVIAVFWICVAVFVFEVVKLPFPFDGYMGVLVMLGLILFLDQATGLRLAALRGLKYAVAGQFPELIVRPVVLIAGVYLASTYWGVAITVTQVLYVLFVAVLCSAATGQWLAKRRLPPTYVAASPARNLKSSIPIALALSANAGFVTVNAQADVLMLGVLAQPADVGIYRIAMQFALLCGFVYSALNFLAAQKFSTLYGAGKREEIVKTARLLARLSVLGTLPIPILFYFFGTELITFIFGPALAPALGPLTILIPGQIVNAVFGMTGTFLIAVGHQKAAILCIVSALIFNVIASAILIPILGPMGAALAATGAGILWNGLLWYKAYQLEGMDLSAFGIWSKDI